MKRRAVGLVLVLFVALSAGGFAQPAKMPYKIGATIPLTGPLAVVFGAMVVAMDMAAADVNKAGGIQGHPLVIVYEDSQGTPQGGIAAMRKLVQVDGVQAVFSGMSNVVTAQIPLADDLKVPTISGVEVPGLFAKSQYSFGNAPTIALEAGMFRDFWKKKGFKRIYAFFGNNTTGQAFAPYVRKAATDAGAQYAEAFFDLGQTDFSGTIARAKDFQPDGIVVSAQGSTAETTIIRQIREQGITVPLFDPANLYADATWRTAVGPYAEGMYFAGQNVDVYNAGPFFMAYRAKAGHSPTYLAANAYDSIKMFAFAMNRGGYNGEAIQANLLHLNGVPSVTGGTIVMEPDHNTVSHSLGLYQVNKDRLVKIEGP